MQASASLQISVQHRLGYSKPHGCSSDGSSFLVDARQRREQLMRHLGCLGVEAFQFHSCKVEWWLIDDEKCFESWDNTSWDSSKSQTGLEFISARLTTSTYDEL